MPKSSKSQEARNLNRGPKVSRMTPLYKEIEQETKSFQNAHFCEISCVRQGGQFRAGVKSYKCHFIGPKAWWNIFVGNQNSQNLNFLGAPSQALCSPTAAQLPKKAKQFQTLCIPPWSWLCCDAACLWMPSYAVKVSRKIHMNLYNIASSTWSQALWEMISQMLLQNAATRRTNVQWQPKGALQNAKSWGKIFQKPEFWKQHGSTTKCQAGCIFFHEKMVLVQNVWPRRN